MEQSKTYMVSIVYINVYENDKKQLVHGRPYKTMEEAKANIEKGRKYVDTTQFKGEVCLTDF